MSTPDRRWTFMIAAGGSGSRLGGTPKQFRMLGGRPMWTWPLSVAERLWDLGLVREAVVVFPKSFSDRAHSSRSGLEIKYADGGETRAQSVMNGLAASSGEYVMIHDAARPFLDESICAELIKSAERCGASIPVLRSVDSLKRVCDDEQIRIVDRNEIYRTQTPQCFLRRDLMDVMSDSGDSMTDEASAWIEHGRRIEFVDGSEKNFKVTTDFDWHVANSLVERSKEVRTGYGYDVHELRPGRRLVLGGLEVESSMGLLGHSDADIICHSISDALLGAAGEGDIGTHFPASDERYRGADSTVLLRKSVEMIYEKGWSIDWIDTTLVAQIPRLGAVIPRIRAHLDGIFSSLGASGRISVKVKSGEHVGSVGRGESMICHSVATIERYAI